MSMPWLVKHECAEHIDSALEADIHHSDVVHAGTILFQVKPCEDCLKAERENTKEDAEVVLRDRIDELQNDCDTMRDERDCAMQNYEDNLQELDKQDAVLAQYRSLWRQVAGKLPDWDTLPERVLFGTPAGPVPAAPTPQKKGSKKP